MEVLEVKWEWVAVGGSMSRCMEALWKLDDTSTGHGRGSFHYGSFHCLALAFEVGTPRWECMEVSTQLRKLPKLPFYLPKLLVNFQNFHLDFQTLHFAFQKKQVDSLNCHSEFQNFQVDFRNFHFDFQSFHSDSLNFHFDFQKIQFDFHSLHFGSQI